MELYFIELPKYERKPKKSIRESTKMERWLAYFANKMTDQEREELAMSEAAIREAMEAERVFLSDPDVYLSYVNRQMAIMDFNTNVKYALKEGREKGIVEGREEGRAEGCEEGRAEGRAEGREEGRAEGRAEGREEGRAEGRAEGREEGENRMARLLTLLYEKGETGEARQAATNPETRHRLYEKYHIE